MFRGHRVVPGTGGGVCQVSTTLYNAVLLADLELVQRFNHSLPVDYVPLGRDAAVAFDEDLDFRFRNNTRWHVLIRASAGEGALTIGIYGQAPEDLRVTISTRLVRTLPYGTETILDPTLPADQTVVVEGRAGKVVAAEARVFAGGRYQIRKLPSSVYVPVPTLVRVGTRSGL
jgi:vancomycin resistance protein YoaR